jgi:CheY-like chemotaxis protein
MTRDPREDCVPSRVLVVDDEPLVRFMLRHFFSMLGSVVEEAADIAAATERLASPHPAYDAVICDLRLREGEEGYEVLRRARAALPRASIVLFTARATAMVAEEARRCGADAVVAKPSPLETLRRVVCTARQLEAAGIAL